MLIDRSRREELSVRRVRSLLAVAEHRSFSEAAKMLGLTQPAVSQHVKQLEEQLQISLMVRDKEGLRLSAGGAALLPAFRRFLSSNGAILDQLASLGRGTEQILRIASPASYAALSLAPAFRSIRESFSKHILDISEIDNEESFHLVRNGDIDFAITSVFVPSPGLRFEVLHQDFACVVVSEENALAGATEIDEASLLSQPIIRFPSGTTSHDWLSVITERTGIEPETIAEVRQLLTGFQMVCQNLGVALVPEDAAKACKLPGLITIPLKDRRLTRKLGIVTSETHHPTDFEKALVKMLRVQQAGLSA
ncbi:LysR family transcriptional regulator [Leisingera sp. S132]|uniref:LysR family transcriptional regulator n=1 Tax=Leisingera sp. S132 TaxID=2867016 RepID=UPI0021A55C6F|nr:LysR family transcriptional regulator [Leisingera sp. S132]UWQ79717.1 LysR family transcriptional regulator [Leisingera sp. S132]